MACERPSRRVNPRYKDMTQREVMDYSMLMYGTVHPPDYIVDLPCGFCKGCQKARMNGYRIRLLMEAASHRQNIFVTLTFDDENLARFKDNYNKSVLLFLDRCRKRYGKHLRHWFCAEFGEENGRIHYHGIIFGYNGWSDYETWKKLWSYGFIWLGWVDASTCSYICKYLTKELSKGQELPRVISSKGLGSAYLTPERIAWHRNVGGTPRPYIEVNGYRQALPRYYFNKIFTEVDKQNMALERYLREFSGFVEGVEYDNRPDYNAALYRLRRKNTSLGVSSAEPPNKPRKRISTFEKYKQLIENESYNSFSSELQEQNSAFGAQPRHDEVGDDSHRSVVPDLPPPF